MANATRRRPLVDAEQRHQGESFPAQPEPPQRGTARWAVRFHWASIPPAQHPKFTYGVLDMDRQAVLRYVWHEWCTRYPADVIIAVHIAELSDDTPARQLPEDVWHHVDPDMACGGWNSGGC